MPSISSIAEIRRIQKIASVSRTFCLAILLMTATARAGNVQWLTLGTGSNATVYALQLSGNTLYAGGTFTNFGGVPANCIAQWNGTNWSALGSGVGGTVWAMAMFQHALYVGGSFTNAGAENVNYIARWDGTNWSGLGTGLGYDGVGAMAASSNVLYVGGYFTNAGGVPANYIAQWDGTNWSALGSGLGWDVLAVTVSGNTVFAGTESVWQWNGTSWTNLPQILGEEIISSVMVWGGALYAGGVFSPPFGGNVQKWNGNAWSPAGNYLIDFWGQASAQAMVIFDNTLYMGGYFTQTGNGQSNISYVAQLNGTNWEAVGAGPPGPAWALAASANTLYAGGYGNNGSYVAMATFPVPLSIVTNNADFGISNGAFGFDIEAPYGSNVVIQSSPDLQTWTPLQTNLIGAGLLNFRDPQPAANTQRFYRAVFSP